MKTSFKRQQEFVTRLMNERRGKGTGTTTPSGQYVDDISAKNMKGNRQDITATFGGTAASSSNAGSRTPILGDKKRPSGTFMRPTQASKAKLRYNDENNLNQ